MILLSRRDVEQCLDVRQGIEAMRFAFEALGRGLVQMPPRAVTPVGEAAHLSMPCYIGGPDPVLCMKVVTFFPLNPSRGMPTTQAVILLNDPSTGKPIAMMDAEYMTLVRTGAVSALATEFLAHESARTLGVFGTGEVGFYQVAAVKEVRVIDNVFVNSLDPAQGSAFCERVESELGVPALFVSDPSTLVEQSDIICLATSSKNPVLHGADVRPGTHVNGVGSFRPDMAETDVEFVSSSGVFVDQISAAQVGAGEILAAVDAGAFSWVDAVELQRLVLGECEGRKGDEVTFFKSVGLAVQDAAVARIVFNHAVENGLGTEFDLG